VTFDLTVSFPVHGSVACQQGEDLCLTQTTNKNELMLYKKAIVGCTSTNLDYSFNNL
jgi:hypothetical protein